MEAVLDLLHVLLQQHHVVHVLLAGHMDPQVPRHVGLVVAHLRKQGGRQILNSSKISGSTIYIKKMTTTATETTKHYFINQQKCKYSEIIKTKKTILQ